MPLFWFYLYHSSVSSRLYKHVKSSKFSDKTRRLSIQNDTQCRQQKCGKNILTAILSSTLNTPTPLPFSHAIFLPLPLILSFFFPSPSCQSHLPWRGREREGDRGGVGGGRRKVCFSGEDNIPRPVPFLSLLIEHTHTSNPNTSAPIVIVTVENTTSISELPLAKEMRK